MPSDWRRKTGEYQKRNSATHEMNLETQRIETYNNHIQTHQQEERRQRFLNHVRGRCLNCLSTIHRVAFCNRLTRCWRCLGEGHKASACRGDSEPSSQLFNRRRRQENHDHLDESLQENGPRHFRRASSPMFWYSDDRDPPHAMMKPMGEQSNKRTLPKHATFADTAHPDHGGQGKTNHRR